MDVAPNRPLPASWVVPMTGLSDSDGADVEAALRACATGGAVVLVADGSTTDGGIDAASAACSWPRAALVFAAAKATSHNVAFAVRHGTGFLEVALPSQMADRLDLPAMVHAPHDPPGTFLGVSVDAKNGTTTGISAADRAQTLRTIANPSTRPEDLSRPGHVVPVRVSAGSRRRDVATHALFRAAIELARIAGLAPCAAVCDVVSTSDPRELADGREAARFAAQHHLPLVTAEQLFCHQLAGRARLVGTVTSGDGRGRILGFPTANIALDWDAELPPDGVYAGRAFLFNGPDRQLLGDAAISVGANPTFGGRVRRIEVHVLGCDTDLYDQTVEVELALMLRPTLTFESAEALVAQIKRDVDEVRRLAGMLASEPCVTTAPR